MTLDEIVALSPEKKIELILDLQMQNSLLLDQVKCDGDESAAKILSICSYCKSVKNDLGHWETIEQHFKKHHDAKCSHGICKDCVSSVEETWRSQMAIMK